MVVERRAAQGVVERALPQIDPSQDALFLDVDGTLIDIAQRPTDVLVPPSLIGLLKQLHARFGGAIAIITGRQIDEVDRLFNPLRLAAAGVHGCEIRTAPDKTIEQQVLSVSPANIAAISVIAAKYPGVMIEPKGTGVAVHYRNVPQNAAQLLSDLHSYFAGQNAQLVVAHGRMVFEVLPTGFSKATAMQQLGNRAPFAGRRPIMIGDDVGDVPAFKYAQRAGGIALRVAGEHFPFDKSEFMSPKEVRDFLSRIVASPSVQAVQTPPTNINHGEN